jgi:hypothetical protein
VHPRIERAAASAVHVSEVVDIANANRPVVESTVNARVKPSDTESVKQELLNQPLIKGPAPQQA